MSILVCLMSPQRPLALSSFFWIFFLVAVLIGCFLLVYLLIADLIPASSTLRLSPPKVVFISDTTFFISDWFFFMFSISTFMFSISSLKFSLSSSTLLLSSLSILITSVLNSASGRLLLSILLSSFSGALFCSFNGDVFLCPPILAAYLCLFLYIR
uniref:Uncharacterized protein n=1 Tax=Rousettus aegyptiacus TaxID=9407 RepID=A0A7J8KBK1_ROUAE|nr:hypothetical protein HJG63_008017 [Rousettus aegyptiacus]